MSALAKGDKMRVTVSDGNSKLGKVLNISLPPVITCPVGVPCSDSCYALKAWKQYPNVRKCWNDNLQAYNDDPDYYFNEILAQVARRKPQLVRWHVSGDIPDREYLLRMLELADALPSRKFLVFTKRYKWLLDITADDIPDNFSAVCSVWPGYEVPLAALDRFPAAYMRDAHCGDDRIAPDARECPGECERCGLCWNLVRGSSVVFDKH